MPEIFDILNTNGEKLIATLRANIVASGQNATGETANSLTQIITQEDTKIKYQLLGRPFFNTIETGRKPTPNKKPSRAMIQNLTRWVDARGIPASAVWGIAINIQKEGTKLFRDGGREDIIQPATDEFINTTTEMILENEAEEFKIKIEELQW